MITSIKSPFNREIEVARIEIKHIQVRLPVHYEEEQIPFDFPMRVGNVWEAKIEVDTGRIVDWPEDKTEPDSMHLKVVDEGQYTLLGANGEKVAFLYCYVPHGIVPGEFGDYVIFQIENGRITNWPKNPNPKDFFQEEEK